MLIIMLYRNSGVYCDIYTTCSLYQDEAKLKKYQHNSGGLRQVPGNIEILQSVATTITKPVLLSILLPT